jgi:uncharacterized protein YdeI (YjbR/CyaY-like superfamily)
MSLHVIGRELRTIDRVNSTGVPAAMPGLAIAVTLIVPAHLPMPTKAAAPIKPTYFATPADFRRWLKQHHSTEPELWVGFHKKTSGRPSITWPESVDEALCYGWIDGLRKSIDAGRYMIRFTPRKTTSVWSSVNTKRATELIRERRMQPAGLAAFSARNAKRSGIYSFEQRRDPTLTPELTARFRANRAAWEFFEAQPPGYRKIVTWWIVSAKQEATRERRLDTLIRQSAAGRRIDFMRPAGGGKDAR